MVAFVNFVDFGVFVAAVDSGQKCILHEGRVKTCVVILIIVFRRVSLVQMMSSLA